MFTDKNIDDYIIIESNSKYFNKTSFIILESIIDIFQSLLTILTLGKFNFFFFSIWRHENYKKCYKYSV